MTSTAWCRTGRSQVRDARRFRARVGEQPAEPQVDVRRARHRRRERVRGSRRVRAHHAWRPGAHPERSRAGRRARARDRARHTEAHAHGDPEIQSDQPRRPGDPQGKPSRRPPIKATKSCSRTTSIAATRWRPTRSASTLANGAGYSPAGLGAFLTRLADRNKALKERSGIFASHPETKARIDALAKVVSSGKLASAATVSARYSTVDQLHARACQLRGRWSWRDADRIRKLRRAGSRRSTRARPRKIQRPDRVVCRLSRRESRPRREGRSGQDARGRQRHGRGNRGVPKGNHRLARGAPPQRAPDLQPRALRDRSGPDARGPQSGHSPALSVHVCRPAQCVGGARRTRVAAGCRSDSGVRVEGRGAATRARDRRRRSSRWRSTRGRASHTPERAPAIVQDATIALLVAVAAVVTFPNAEFLTTSAIVAAVMGFALQETLGNAFAGLAIQIEKPFRVGHWITVGNHEGSVREITWRATKILTKSGNMVVLPNSLVAREAINNYSEPISPTRTLCRCGCWLSECLRTSRATPCLLRSFTCRACSASSRNRRRCSGISTARPSFFACSSGSGTISVEEVVRDEVRRAIYYELSRRGIEIPWPIQVEYSRQEPGPGSGNGPDRTICRNYRTRPVFAELNDEGRRALAAGAAERLYGDGELIVREGAPARRCSSCAAAALR